MSRNDVIEAHRHEIAGLVLDAATAGLKGAELACWLRTVMRRIDLKLGAIYDDSVRPEATLPISERRKA